MADVKKERKPRAPVTIESVQKQIDDNLIKISNLEQRNVNLRQKLFKMRQDEILVAIAESGMSFDEVLQMIKK